MTTIKRKQKQTLKEFKAWLQGVEELQADNWSPNRDQWQLIRNKIDGIKEEKNVVEKTIMQPMRPTRPSSPRGFYPAPIAGGVPEASEVNMSEAAKALLNGSSGQPGDHGKTPNIDTSDGNVTSPFA